MREIKLPKSTWISKAYVDFCREGHFRGVLMAHVVLSSSGLGDLDEVESLVNALEELRAEASFPARRIVRFSGTYTPGDITMETLVKGLSDYGYELQAVLAGDVVPHPWLERISWLVIATSKPRVLWAANEVWYSPKMDPENPDAPIRDLEYPATANRNPILYLFGRLSYEAAERFVAGSKSLWILHV